MKAIVVQTDTADIDGDMRNELLQWAQSLGLDTKLATAAFVLIENGSGWRAYFSMKRQRDGHDYVDPNTHRLAVDYGSSRFDVPAGSWPRWFGHPMVLPDMPAGHLLDVLAASKDFASAVKTEAWHRAHPEGVAS